jgi:hypothetical protein
VLPTGTTSADANNTAEQANQNKGGAHVNENAWTGWIVFAGWLMIIIGSLDFFEGLIAVIRDNYYALTPNQIIVFDLSTWGWIMMIFGILVVLTGFGLLGGAGWARWTAVVIGSLSFLLQLGFVGSSPYPLWALAGLALTVFVLYALIVRWNDATPVAV